MNEKRRILIVEDQADLRKLLRLTLAVVDCELHEADSGQAALSLLKTLKPDTVILDIMLPGGIDGYQICRAIKADPATSRTFVILLSARGQKSDIEEGRRAGADCYLLKPFSPLELVKTVNKDSN